VLRSGGQPIGNSQVHVFAHIFEGDLNDRSPTPTYPTKPLDTRARRRALFAGCACTGPGLAGSVRRYRRPEAEGPRQGHGHRLADPADRTLETFTPVTIISAEDIQARGFNNVAEVLQGSSFSTGGVQNNQSSASFTQGAETLSLFGLSAELCEVPDRRPADGELPGAVQRLGRVQQHQRHPVELVERIEILPGGQSSLYGSDAIAGVVNIILKKNIDGAILSGRFGGYDEGGGRSGRISFADSVSAVDDKLNIVFGIQAEKSDPVWGYQRDLTSQFNTNGYNGAPQLASRDWLVYSPFTSYKFLDPANCANVSGGFDGSVEMQTRPGFGDENYCGSMTTPGYRTLKNSKEGVQLYTHATWDFNDLAQGYADVLLSHEKVKYHVGSNYTWWGTSVKWGYFYDPELDDFLNLQRAFTPEDMGGWENSCRRTRAPRTPSPSA
jgi:iron complex outermembrane receptor protein